MINTLVFNRKTLEFTSTDDPEQISDLCETDANIVWVDVADPTSADFDVKANFCVADTSKPGQACTADCGTAHADCSFGQPLAAGEHQVKLGTIVVGFQVPSKLPLGGLCAGTR